LLELFGVRSTRPARLAILRLGHWIVLPIPCRIRSWTVRLQWGRDQYELPTGTDKFLCYWALGLSAWAVQRGLVSIGELPPDNVYCPCELIALARAG
jgi:hypothetical protein